LLKKNSRRKESNRSKQRKEGERSFVVKHRRVTANHHRNSLSAGTLFLAGTLATAPDFSLPPTNLLSLSRVKMEIGTRMEEGERNMCCLCSMFFLHYILWQVNLGYQFDWLLEMIIFLVAVDKIQYKAAHGRNDYFLLQ
jgi:hypothetical protein